MRDRFQSFDGPTAERRRKLLGHLAVANGVLFPDDATQTLAAILKVRFDKDLEILLMGRVNICGRISGFGPRPEPALTPSRPRSYHGRPAE